VAISVSASTVATIAGTRSKTPANCKTNPKFPNIALIGGLRSRGGVAVASLMAFAIVA